MILKTISKFIKLSFFFWLLITCSQAFAAENQPAIVLTVNGAIGPATAEYIAAGIKTAKNENASCVVIEMDTPGGLDKSMRSIIKSILASSVPVISYVSPSGARAASAGTYILYASHIAAMAPGTNLGAATPVNMLQSGQNKDKNEKSQSASDKKMQNDAIAYIESLARLRDRNTDFAVKAITEAASIPASKALKMNVINLMANNLSDLLQKVNGQKVSLANEVVTLNTTNVPVKYIKPNFKTKFLAIITNPSFAYILLLIGIYGLFFEFANPGFIVPGVAGAIALVLALYAFHLLPVSFAGISLMIIGIIFIIAEAFVPSFGALGLGGMIAFIIGSIFLMDTSLKAFQIPWGLIITMGVMNALFFFGIIGMAIRSSKRKIVSGKEHLRGLEGHALENIPEANTGWVWVNGERWKAKTQQNLQKNDTIEVVEVHGLELTVKKRET